MLPQNHINVILISVAMGGVTVVASHGDVLLFTDNNHQLQLLPFAFSNGYYEDKAGWGANGYYEDKAVSKS